MDRFVSSGSLSSAADPGSVAADAGAAASATAATLAASAEQQHQHQQPDAPAALDADDVVEVVAKPGGVQVKSKEADRLARLKRVQTEQRKSKPSGASAYSWTYFQVYTKAQYKAFALCKLCLEQQEFCRAEIKYAQSPSNLMRHLNTEFPGHRAAFDDCTRRKTGNSSFTSSGAGAASGVTSDSTGLTGIKTYFGKDTSTWHQCLVRWMVMNAIPFSVRYACVHVWCLFFLRTRLWMYMQ